MYIEVMKNKDKKILYIEDKKDHQMVFLHFAREENSPNDYTIAESVKEASSILEREKFDVVVTEYCLGDGTVLDLFEKTNGSPIIILTSSDDREIYFQAMKAGAYNYLIKDNKGNFMKTLSVAIERAISQKRNEEELSRLRDDRKKIEELVIERIVELQKEVDERKRDDRWPSDGFAYDFNTILYTINGFAEITLEKMDKDNPLRKNIEIILEAGENGVNLAKQLFTFSRNQKTEKKILNLNNVIENMHKMLKRIILKDIKINIVAESQLGNIMADPSQIERMIMNLIINAKEAMPKGGNLDIETKNVVIGKEYSKVHPYAKKGKYVLITISDTGCGMPEEVKDNIFEPFFTTKESGKGAGLGMTTVYGIIKQSNGFIDVFSQPNKGSTFKIYLPCICTKIKTSKTGYTKQNRRRIDQI
jgi:signal transduction histidine kinase